MLLSVFTHPGYGLMNYAKLRTHLHLSIISKRTLDFKPGFYFIELCPLFFDMISGLKVIKKGNECITLHFA